MALPIEDTLLLILVAAAMSASLLGDLAGLLKRPPRRGGGASTSAAAATAAVAVARKAATPVLPNAADLLLVDDSAVARAKLRRLFEAAGYRVELANDGIEALAKLHAGSYAMMITDLEMPNMDGVELINTCLRQPLIARMPIIAVSGHENLRAKFNECRNIAGVHRKPWSDEVLLSHVAALVGTRVAPARATVHAGLAGARA